MPNAFESSALAGEAEVLCERRAQAGEDALQLLAEMLVAEILPPAHLARAMDVLLDARCTGWTHRQPRAVRQ